MSGSTPNRPSYLRTISSTSTTSTTSTTRSRARKNKLRLYIALYPRGGSTSSFTTCSNCDSYHWSLLVGPSSCSRSDPGTRYHIAHNPQTTEPFLYEESDILTSGPASTLLIRVAIAKVRDIDAFQATLRSLPIPSISTEPSSTCLSWTRAAFSALVKKKSCLKSYLSASDWKDVEACARKYCKRKRDLRRFTNAGPWDLNKVSTYNFWENREIMS
jgi:hypothetical protein